MRLRLISILVLCAFAGIMTGCSDDPVMPEEAATVTGTTDGTGLATLSIGPYSVEITVTTSSMATVSGADVTCYLLQEHLLTIGSSPDGSYYPGLTVTSLADAQSRHRAEVGNPDRVNSPKAARETVIAVELIMDNSSLAAYGYDINPPNYNLIQSDSWVTETSRTMDMESFYALADSVDYQGAVLVHLNDNMISSTGAGRSMASFLLPQIASFEAFSALMSLELRIFSGDTITVSTMSYLGGQLPLIDISGISMNRDFWLQFTLTWGQDPRDLDSHLFTPEIPGEFDTTAYHVYYASRGYAESAPFADLDVDDVSSFGPEHVTIWDEFPGTYVYAVYHYSGTGTIVTSEAQVDLLQPDGTVQSFAVPENASASSNYWWHVCNVDGTTGVVTVVDTIAATSPGAAAGPLSRGGIEIMPPKISQ